MVLADTGYWLALANPKDNWHGKVVDVTRRLNETLVVTWPVVTETCYLISNRLDVQAELLFVKQLSKNVHIHEIGQERLGEIHILIEKYADLPMDFADASLVLAANDLGDGRILSTDRRDFKTYRWKNKEPFRNLLDSE